jgi:hypothetical protein
MLANLGDVLFLPIGVVVVVVVVVVVGGGTALPALVEEGVVFARTALAAVVEEDSNLFALSCPIGIKIR